MASKNTSSTISLSAPFSIQNLIPTPQHPMMTRFPRILPAPMTAGSMPIAASAAAKPGQDGARPPQQGARNLLFPWRISEFLASQAGGALSAPNVAPAGKKGDVPTPAHVPSLDRRVLLMGPSMNALSHGFMRSLDGHGNEVDREPMEMGAGDRDDEDGWALSPMTSNRTMSAMVWEITHWVKGPPVCCFIVTKGDGDFSSTTQSGGGDRPGHLISPTRTSRDPKTDLM